MWGSCSRASSPAAAIVAAPPPSPLQIAQPLQQRLFVAADLAGELHLHPKMMGAAAAALTRHPRTRQRQHRVVLGARWDVEAGGASQRANRRRAPQ